MILNIAVPGIFMQPLDYLEKNTSKSAEIGQRVFVMLRNKKVCGIIVKISDRSDINLKKLKPIIEIIDDTSKLSKSYIKLLIWISTYYHYPLFSVFEVALPKFFIQGKNISLKQEVNYHINQKILNINPELLAKNATVQKEFLLHLHEKSNKSENIISKLSIKQFSTATIKSAIKKNWLTENSEDIKLSSNNKLVKRNFELNLEQQQAINAFSNDEDINNFSVTLLYGVTGSGKTEVYIEIIKKVLSQRKQILLLVPEISLTPQTLSRIQQRFTEPVITLHSGQSKTEREQNWILAKTGQSNIIIATRSGLFCPFQNLGIIIIDEEHDSSFKQQSQLRYHARNIAIMMAKINNFPIILGTATPSIETYYNVKMNKYKVIYLNKRTSKSNPEPIYLIDLKNQPETQGLSTELKNKISLTVDKNEQVLLFINRRGYSPALICHSCGWIAMCKRCDAPYTLHNNPQSLSCHHCNSNHPIMVLCQNCKSNSLITTGVATEKLEELLINDFPNKKILRIDRTNIYNSSQLNDSLEAIHNGWADIIIGTQMITKGHHFKNVTLVGIIDIDGGLFSTDFRALEKTAQQIVQVFGRSGREEKKGEVYLQTHQPQHPMIQTLLNHGYKKLLDEILIERE
ncbi:MAG: primosomal protein N' (replication factor Y), partial [Francisellaceae bacterium]